MMGNKTVRIGTRRSQLAMWQTQHVCRLLAAALPNIECVVVPFVTIGDRTQAAGKPLAQIGGKGLFTAELEQALRDGSIDCAVHSLKDLPTENPEQLVLGAIPARADARDVLIARSDVTLEMLPRGATIGTGSLRRAAQLLAHRPNLVVRPIRGNVDTRLCKALDGEYDAIVLAAAGVERLGLTAHITQWLSFDTMLPAPGQGALAVQCRADDEATLSTLRAIEQTDIRRCVTAERAFLAHLQGGCSTPIAAYATIIDNILSMRGLVSANDGSNRIVVAGSGEAAEQLGQELAESAVQQGALGLIDGR